MIIYDDTYRVRQRDIPIAIYANTFHNLQENAVFTPIHYHKDFEILYITGGRSQMKISGNTFFAEKGDLILINPYQVHYGEVISRDFNYICLDFDIEMLSLPYQQELISGSTVYRNLISNKTALCDMVSKCYNEILNMPEGWQLRSRGLLMILFSHLGKYLSDSYPSKEEDFARRMLDYFDNNYAKNINSASAAKFLNYDQSYFCRKFKNTFYSRFCDYLNFFRITKAKELLNNNTVSQAAVSCGFSSIGYFSKTFKQITGITPSEYRNGTDEN